MATPIIRVNLEAVLKDCRGLPRIGAGEFLERLSKHGRVVIETDYRVLEAWQWIKLHMLERHIHRIDDATTRQPSMVEYELGHTTDFGEILTGVYEVLNG